MVTDGQVCRLRRELDSGTSLASAARRTGMSNKTARHYRDHSALPGVRRKLRGPRSYRTRPDPFAAVWPMVEERLRTEPRLLAKTLFDWLRLEHPGLFLDSHRRTFERRVRQWRARLGPNKAIMFRQVHEAGEFAASDFTHMNSLNITIAGRKFDHMVYHFVLTYSNWESVTVCASESFEALSDGLQNAFWELGGVPRRHRSDSLSAAVNNLSATREFQTRYRDLLAHYDVTGQRINVRQAHENGDAESSHGHYKTAVDQALLLRGSRDFACHEEYVGFLKQTAATRNVGRQDRFAEELAALRRLPDQRLSSCRKIPCRVDTGSLIHIHRNTYSVHSRLIGEQVEAWLFADHVEVWYADKLVDTLPRLVGRDRHAVHYRHVIDSLIRKPGAFANYVYREDLFPTTRFRIAYDRFCEGRDNRKGVKDYLKILHHAAHNSEAAIDDALRVLLANDAPLSVAMVIAMAEASTELPHPTMVVVGPPDLKEFDALLTFMEETHGQDIGETNGITANDSGSPATNIGATDGTVSGTPAADIPRSLPEPGRSGCEGELELHTVPGSSDEFGSRSPHAWAHPQTGNGSATAGRQDLGPISVVAIAEAGAATVSGLAQRRLPGSPRKRFGVREARLWKNSCVVRCGRTTHLARASHTLRDLHVAGARVACGQARSQAGTLPEEVGWLRGLGHRRPGLCTAKPRRNGGAFHAACGALRARHRDAHKQSTVFTVDRDLQGSDDHRGRHRPLGSPQCDRRAKPPKLPARNRKRREAVNGQPTGTGSTLKPITHWGILIVAKGEFLLSPNTIRTNRLTEPLAVRCHIRLFRPPRR